MMPIASAILAAVSLPRGVILGILAIPIIFGSVPFARRFVLLLTTKYLIKRRLAWVSLAAVAMCVALVLIVLSVMGGWLEMFRDSFKTMTGDVIVSRSQTGFGYYEEMIAQVEKLPDVEAAIPVIETAGLLRIGSEWSDYVGVVGLPNDKVERVMHFHDSLWLQHNLVKVDPTATLRPNVGFDLWDDVPYEAYAPTDKQARSRPGMIVGAGAIGVHKDMKTGHPDWPPSLNLNFARLIVVPGNNLDPGAQVNATTTPYWIVDGSRTQTPQHDKNVYVPFDQLQRDLNMTASNFDKRVPSTTRPGKFDLIPRVEPARTTAIHIKVRPGVRPADVVPKVAAIVDQIADGKDSMGGIKVQTWEQEQGVFLNAIENEIGIVTTLFSLISVVAVFMIFCIFYTIVAEKTRDIGILKAVGASAWSVAQIFLVYGAAIGLVGGAAGIALSWIIVKYINPIHTFISWAIGRPIYNSDVYAFDRLPNQLNWSAAIVIWIIGIGSAIFGATVPAIRAARLKPVESLRFE